MDVYQAFLAALENLYLSLPRQWIDRLPKDAPEHWFGNCARV